MDEITFAAKPVDTAYIAFKREDDRPVSGPAFYVTEGGEFVPVAVYNAGGGGNVWFALSRVRGFAKAQGLPVREV